MGNCLNLKFNYIITSTTKCVLVLCFIEYIPVKSCQIPILLVLLYFQCLALQASAHQNIAPEGSSSLYRNTYELEVELGTLTWRGMK